MFETSVATLNELIDVLAQLPEDGSYTRPCPLLSNATIGQHTRHIIEMYQCVLNGFDIASVDYDGRKRNKVLESDCFAAIGAIREIQAEMPRENRPLRVLHALDGSPDAIDSNYYREMLYNLDHCIHHQALIRVALAEAGLPVKVSDAFGVAPSTLQYRSQCVQ